MTISLEATSPGPECPPASSGGDANWAPVPFILAAYLLVFAAVTMVNVALPAAQDDLGMSDGGRQWVLTGYSLAFGGFMLLGGRVGDVLGLRRAVVIGLVGFGAASLAGGLAVNGAMLVAARASQGVAGALVAPSALALLSATFPAGPGRARAFALLGTVMGIGTAGTFVVAGLLTDVTSWRWCLLLNVPIAAVAAAGLTRTAPRVPGARQPIDVASAGTVTAGLALLVLAFDRAGRGGWTAPPTLLLAAAGVALLIVFVRLARRVRAPLLPLELLTARARRGGYLAVAVLAVGMFASMYMLTVHMQDVLGYSALRTGLGFLPFGIGSIVMARVLTAASGRRSATTALALGLVATAAGIALLATLRASSGYMTAVLPTVVLLGVGGTTVMVTATNVVTADAGASTGAASGAIGAIQQVGAALGTALLGSIAVGVTEDRYGAPRPAVSDDAWLDAVAHGFARAAAVGALLVAAGAVAVVALAGRRRRAAA